MSQQRLNHGSYIFITINKLMILTCQGVETGGVKGQPPDKYIGQLMKLLLLCLMGVGKNCYLPSNGHTI